MVIGNSVSASPVTASFVMANIFYLQDVLEGDEVTTSEALDMAFEIRLSEVEMFPGISFTVHFTVIMDV